MIIGTIESADSVKRKAKIKAEAREINNANNTCIEILAQELFDGCAKMVEDDWEFPYFHNVILDIHLYQLYQLVKKYCSNYAQFQINFNKACEIVVDMLKEAGYHAFWHPYCRNWVNKSGKYGYIYFDVR